MIEASPSDGTSQVMITPVSMGAEYNTGEFSELSMPYRVGRFGVFTEKAAYAGGCVLADALDDAEVVLWKGGATDAAHGAYRAAIGLTPNEYNPGHDGSLLEGAGEFGNYLFYMHRSGREPRLIHRYVDLPEIEDAVVAAGRDVQFAPNRSRGRRICVEGLVREVSGYRSRATRY